jgi:hypothetical protein
MRSGRHRRPTERPVQLMTRPGPGPSPIRRGQRRTGSRPLPMPSSATRSAAITTRPTGRCPTTWPRWAGPRSRRRAAPGSHQPSLSRSARQRAHAYGQQPHAPFGEHIDGRQPFRQHNRVVMGQQQEPRCQQDPPSGGRDETAVLRVPGHRDHAVGVDAVDARVVADPELHRTPSRHLRPRPFRNLAAQPHARGRGISGSRLRAAHDGFCRHGHRWLMAWAGTWPWP